MILLLQNHAHDDAAYLGAWLAAQGERWRVVQVHAGEPVPTRCDGIDAIAVLGGPMSVNDPLPGLRATEALLRDAVACDVPVLGHCLGGQLLASALGAPIVRNALPEIGWHPIAMTDGGSARAWFGAHTEATVFQWHHDTFALPRGATPVARSAVCAQQAFAIGRSLGMQFHIEVDAAKLALWFEHGADDIAAHAHLPTVQSAATMRAGIARHLAASQTLADAIYTRWRAGFRTA